MGRSTCVSLGNGRQVTKAAGPAWQAWDGGCEVAIDTFWELCKQHFWTLVRLITAGLRRLRAQREDLVQVVLVKVKELRTRGSFSFIWA